MQRIGGWLAVVALSVCCLTMADSSAYGQRGGRRGGAPAGGQGQPPAIANTPIAGGAPAAAPVANAPSSAVEPLRTAADRPFDIRDIKLDLKVDLEGKKVDGEATLQIRDIKPTQSISLDAVGFEVKRVTSAKGNETAAPAKFNYDGNKLAIDLGSRWTTGQEGLVHIVYQVKDPKDGLHFFGPSKAEPDVPLLMWSQGEPTSNRYWIPCYDEPDQRQTTEIVATVPEGNEVVSNGKLLSRKPNSSDKTVTFDWRQDKPHPAYLVTLVVGKFEVVQEEWEGIPVLYYVAPGRKAEVQPTFARTRDMLTYFSKQFGVRYPWDKYAQVMCYQYGGGMENTSATTMGDRILLDERSLLDRNSDGIISHELAHQWWGDMLTCRDWSHLWLNEGFASYAEALWDEHHKGKDDYAYNMFQKAHGSRGGPQGGAIGGGKTRPVMDRHYTSPGSMFDGRSYPKGAWVLHMLRHELGDDAFWQGIKAYAIENQLRSVESGDFRRAMERATGRDLERFFYDWVERPGNPDLEVTTEYLPDNQQARVVVKQTQPGEAYHFPLKVVLHTSGANTPTVLEQEITEKELTLRVPVAAPLTRVDVDPDQAVLSDIKETKSAQLWRAQLLEGPSVPLRIQAARHFSQSKTDEDRELLAKAFTGEKYWAVQVELATALGAAGGNVSRDALLQGLHAPDARVRRACVDALGKFKDDASVAGIIKETMQKGDPSYAVEGATLSAYAHLKQKDAIALITPYLSKPSHEDVIAGSALTALGQTQDPATLETLLAWTQPGKPRNCRTAALRGLTEVAKNKDLTEAQKQQILKPLTEALQRDDRFLRFTILNTLPELGPLAASTLPAVDKLVAEAPDGRVKEMAKGVADRIRAQTTGRSTGGSADLGQLREEIKKLQSEQEKLRQRLEKFEKVEAQPKK